MAHAPNKSDKYHQGYYKIQNHNKYIGNPNEIVYRSSWEYKFMIYCDLNPGILKWGSEVFKISYTDRLGKGHAYIPDFYIETVNKDNPDFLNKFLIEVKPLQETMEPIIPKTISEKKMKSLEYQVSAWQKNKYKWAHAIEWCNARDIKFYLVTEEQLGKLNV